MSTVPLEAVEALQHIHGLTDAEDFARVMDVAEQRFPGARAAYVEALSARLRELLVQQELLTPPNPEDESGFNFAPGSPAPME